MKVMHTEESHITHVEYQHMVHIFIIFFV